MEDNQVGFLDFLVCQTGDCSGEFTAALWSKSLPLKTKQKKHSFSGFLLKTAFTSRSTLFESSYVFFERQKNLLSTHQCRETAQIGVMRFFPLEAALYTCDPGVRTKMHFFIFVNFILYFYFLFFSRGSWKRIGSLGGGGINKKWFIVQLCLSLSNGI